MSSQENGLFSKLFFTLFGLLILGILFSFYQLFSNWNGNLILRDDVVKKDSLSSIQINVLNGCGKSGVADKVTNYLRNLGYDIVDVGNYQNFNVKETLVIDRIGEKLNFENQVPYLIASQLGIKKQNVVQQINPSFYVNTTILIGSDFNNLKPWK
ncbi:MAG: LytR C-terminal domain-containing protein [Bacteroidetes bacterium]|nr:LytR C-terminal domain-containing protein [Bacteroidota bacterium]